MVGRLVLRVPEVGDRCLPEPAFEASGEDGIAAGGATGVGWSVRGSSTDADRIRIAL